MKDLLGDFRGQLWDIRGLESTASYMPKKKMKWCGEEMATYLPSNNFSIFSILLAFL